MVTILPQTKERRQDPPLGIRYLGSTPDLLLPSKLHLSANPPQPEGWLVLRGVSGLWTLLIAGPMPFAPSLFIDPWKGQPLRLLRFARNDAVGEKPSPSPHPKSLPFLSLRGPPFLLFPRSSTFLHLEIFFFLSLRSFSFLSLRGFFPSGHCDVFPFVIARVLPFVTARFSRLVIARFSPLAIARVLPFVIARFFPLRHCEVFPLRHCEVFPLRHYEVFSPSSLRGTKCRSNLVFSTPFRAVHPTPGRKRGQRLPQTRKEDPC